MEVDNEENNRMDVDACDEKKDNGSGETQGH